MIAYLGLGSNLGDRSANLAAARQALPPLVIIQRASSIYETEPWGVTDQPVFLNQVIEVETKLNPLTLMAHIKTIEKRLGRRPSFRNGPRLIDMDILLYDDLVLDQPTLVIPHPRMTERAFVLVPLAELVPNINHPRSGETVSTLLARVETKGVVCIEPAPAHFKKD